MRKDAHNDVQLKNFPGEDPRLPLCRCLCELRQKWPKLFPSVVRKVPSKTIPGCAPIVE